MLSASEIIEMEKGAAGETMQDLRGNVFKANV